MILTEMLTKTTPNKIVFYTGSNETAQDLSYFLVSNQQMLLIRKKVVQFGM
jgi:hypothetical protein